MIFINEGCLVVKSDLEDNCERQCSLTTELELIIEHLYREEHIPKEMLQEALALALLSDEEQVNRMNIVNDYVDFLKEYFER